RSTADVAGFMATVFTSGSPTASQIMTVITPMLAVRSDTFRIRGYGEAFNPSAATKLEAAAQCEAIVQRTTGLAPNGLGNKFVLIYFRWLGPGDRSPAFAGFGAARNILWISREKCDFFRVSFARVAQW
ncbi:MAG: hypothetical protein PSW75_02585, partial [bacterium]|nr:hypothetical protein [bacterium]